MRPTAPVAWAASLMAAGASVAALLIARAALRRASAAARPSGLQLAVTDGEARRSLADDARAYALCLRVANGSGAAATASGVTLRVTYRTRANFLGAVDLLPEPAHALPPERAVVQLPLTVAAGQEVSGWLLFRTTNVIPRHCRVQDYALILMFEDGRRHIVDASLPQVLAADSDGPGPATWGWD